MLDGVLYELGVGLQLQEFHYGIFVASNRPPGYAKPIGYFFHGMPFGQELNDFPLPRSRLRDEFTRSRGAQGDIGQAFRDAGRYVGTTLQNLIDGSGQLQSRCLL